MIEEIETMKNKKVLILLIGTIHSIHSSQLPSTEVNHELAVCVNQQPKAVNMEALWEAYDDKHRSTFSGESKRFRGLLETQLQRTPRKKNEPCPKAMMRECRTCLCEVKTCVTDTVCKCIACSCCPCISCCAHLAVWWRCHYWDRNQ